MTISASVPGINGLIRIDGAASEDTLRALLAATAKANNLNARSIREAEAALRGQAASANETAASLRDLSVSAAGSADKSKSAFRSIAEGFGDASGIFSTTNYQLERFGASLVTTAADIGKTWMRTFTDISADPITRASSTLSKTVSLASNGISTLAGQLTKNSGIIGKSAGGLVQGLSTVANAGFQVVNELLAQEITNTAKAMEKFNTTGASFAGGMMDMRTMALNSGLSMDQFATVIKANSQEVRAFGGTIAGGSFKVSKVMSNLAETTGTSGKTLREELLNMGIGLEEQAQIATTMMADQRAVIGQNEIRKRSEKELALETRKYAEDLKVLAEQTGQDAKAIRERARLETQRGALMSRLTKDEQKSLTDAFSGMSTVPENIRKNFELALAQELAGGTITDPLVASNQEYVQYIKEAAQRVRQGGDEIQNEQLKSTARLADTIKEQTKVGQGVGAAADTAVLFSQNLGGITQQLADANTAFLRFTGTVEGIEQSQKNIKNVANTTEELTNAFTKIQTTASDFNKNFGHIASTLLPGYADIIKATTVTMTQAVTKLGQVTTGQISLEGFYRDLKNGIVQAIKDAFGSQPAGQTAPRGARAIGGPVKEGESYVVGEKGQELFTPTTDGMIIPSSNPRALSTLPELKNTQDMFANLMLTMQKQQQTQRPDATPRQDTNTELPVILSEALESVLQSPSGLTSAMTSLKTQLADDNRAQMGMMQEQISKLNDLVTAVQDNIRVNENIANVLS